LEVEVTLALSKINQLGKKDTYGRVKERNGMGKDSGIHAQSKDPKQKKTTDLQKPDVFFSHENLKLGYYFTNQSFSHKLLKIS
jgi:hypothetical protein